ncbi:hypothetical protein HBI81_039070 [Parastagonospora nodorum]|nr:hypothetical protein HBH53_008960 [Parastagonospora nodorum]KAH4058757.1 hypothetical protein HBH49_037250 [Parastagonospora nodorum]KAH4198436.1 hypothetical protein HBH42_044360 [Parastagonospora nodorum]KAH4237586.1 hypothetical protein HBI05_123100 [Parastagonospora nodorum]KAH4238510.1 hypothetical protein HBI06_044920 [Parastagonospora nodorum]
MKSTVATLLALSSTALAHGGVTRYTIDGKTYDGYKWASPYEGQKDLIQRTWHQDPHKDATSSNMTCNYHGTTVPGAYHAPVTAGSTISAAWNQLSFGWVHDIGPMMAYMASCGEDCSTTNIAELEWFKIAEEGLRPGFAIGDDGAWYQYDIWEDNIRDHWNVTVPKSLKPGKYMIRHEIINLELSPAQFYPNCAQLDVSGEGEAVPSAEYLVKFPGGYKMTDPGIVIAGKAQQDKVTKDYTVPGPRVWTE